MWVLKLFLKDWRRSKGKVHMIFLLAWNLFILISLSGKGYCAPQIPASARRTLFTEPTKTIPGPEKNYTGIRIRDDSTQIVYHHEQTIAVVEVGKERELFNCELLEVRTKPDKKVALRELKKYIPKRQYKITFNDMNNLMEQCQLLESPKTLTRRFRSDNGPASSNQVEPRGLSSLLNGVYPGTKWCGTGDIAGSYFDLGPDEKLDKCCRTHDLCPVKVAGLKTQYNITNYSLYTRSHCDCDKAFYTCLKKIKSTVSEILGNIYFNVAQVVCVEDVPSETDVNTIVKQFRSNRKRF